MYIKSIKKSIKKFILKNNFSHSFKSFKKALEAPQRNVKIKV